MSLYEAAEVIASQQLFEALEGLGVEVVFESLAARRLRVDEVYYCLITKKPIFISDLAEAGVQRSYEQLSLQF